MVIPIMRNTSILKISRRTVSEATLAKMRTRVHTEEIKIRKSITTAMLVVAINTKKNQIPIQSRSWLVLGVFDSTTGRYIKSGNVLLHNFLLTSPEM